jgi:hypothetical protein
MIRGTFLATTVALVILAYFPDTTGGLQVWVKEINC